MEISIEKHNNGKVVLICPGKDGSIDGYGGKYRSLSEKIVEEKLAAVVRISNPNTNNSDREINLVKAIEYIRKNVVEITGRNKLELTIIGVSAGARSTALLASKNIEIKNILLVEPAKVYDEEKMANSLSVFTGKIGIIVGDGDNSLGIEVGKTYKSLALYKEQVEIENCDHYFSSKEASEKLNQWIMEKLKVWL